ncbi:MAG: hypothetical protein QW423_02970 [Candidatus Aenigmatarchaeota archaeon]
MKETVVCKFCLEPIFNFICVNCLETSIKKWLFCSNLLKDFKKFSKNLRNRFESNFEKEKCIKCGMPLETSICPYCYTKEVFDFFYLKDKTIAEGFIRVFNFDFLKVGHGSDTITVKNFTPIMISEDIENSDINICENCENQSDDLKKVNGSYICEVCRDEA